MHIKCIFKDWGKEDNAVLISFVFLFCSPQSEYLLQRQTISSCSRFQNINPQEGPANVRLVRYMQFSKEFLLSFSGYSG